MGFNLSPSVEFSEEDLTQFVAGASSSTGGLVGDFAWGPIGEVTQVTSEEDLVAKFHEPDSKNFKDWFTAANFLAYTTNLKLVRSSDATDSARNSRMLGSLTATGTGVQLIKNKTDFDTSDYVTENTSHNFGTPFVARYAGVFGDRLSISYAQSLEFVSWQYKSAFSQAPTGFEVAVVVMLDGVVVETYLVSTLQGYKDGYGSNNYIDDVINRQSEYVYSFVSNFDVTRPWLFHSANESGDMAFLDYVGNDGNADNTLSLTAGLTTASLTVTSGVAQFDSDIVGTKIKVTSGLNKDEIYVVTASSLTTNTHTITLDKAPTYTQLLNFNTAGTFNAIEENRMAASTNSGGVDPIGIVETFSGGVDVGTIVAADIISGWGLMDSADEIDVSLLMEGAGDDAKLIANHLISNVAEVRLDAVAFVSPLSTDVIGSSTPVTNLVTTRNLMPSSSYAFMDGNYKYQYDRYNDTYRWVPFNGDIAGLAARTDYTNDSWWSFAGYNRGIIKSVTKVAFSNSKKSQRDDLYQSQINPIIQEAGSGTLLLGDKTMQVKDSAFSFINVRRLFIALEKAIANAAKFNLFEFNDEFTRTRFVQLVTPFLRDVQGRRGITEFSVIADTTVNTPQVINAGEFASTILIKPNRSINFIKLTFTAVAEGVSFDEIIA